MTDKALNRYIEIDPKELISGAEISPPIGTTKKEEPTLANRLSWLI